MSSNVSGDTQSPYDGPTGPHLYFIQCALRRIIKLHLIALRLTSEPETCTLTTVGPAQLLPVEEQTVSAVRSFPVSTVVDRAAVWQSPACTRPAFDLKIVSITSLRFHELSAYSFLRYI